VGDKAWLHFQKEHLTRPNKNLHPLHYETYTPTKAVGENYFELSIFPFLALHPMFNVDLLRPYVPPLLDTSEIVEELTLKNLKHDCMEQESIYHIKYTWINGTQE
jgi:hypothetical protein